MKYAQRNKNKSEQTAAASKYPQGYFKAKPCKWCNTEFIPNAPSEKYCKDECKDTGLQNAYFFRQYKIGVKDYEQLLENQDHKCKICESEGFLMKGCHIIKLVVDHCHTTGKVRGLLCHNCNRAIGLLHDKAQNLLNAIEYLKV